MLEETLPFWIQHAPDQQYGGFITSLDQDGSVVDTDKGIWQQGRFCWLLGELYNEVEPRPEWLMLADSGLKFLERHGFDPADDRMWFQVKRDGTPVRKRRYSFGESFAAMAFGEMAKATRNQRYADMARKLFEQFISHNTNWTDPQPKYTGHRQMRGIGFPMIALNTAQQLRDSIGLEDAEEHIDRAIDIIRRFHVKPDLRCVMECVAEDGSVVDSFEGRTLNPGHAIEGAWFVMQEGKTRGDHTLIDLGCEMLDWMWERGWDEQHGGLLYFVGLDQRPVQEYWHDMKFWWPHNEAIIATLMAFSLTGNQKYKIWHRQVHDWSYSHFPDTQFGEWFGYLRRDGSVSSTLKGNIWKGPFHLPRMQLVCWRLLESARDGEVST